MAPEKLNTGLLCTDGWRDAKGCTVYEGTPSLSFSPPSHHVHISRETKCFTEAGVTHAVHPAKLEGSPLVGRSVLHLAYGTGGDPEPVRRSNPSKK